MARPVKVRVNPDDLQGLADDIAYWLDELEANFALIDQNIDELREFWVGAHRDEFFREAGEVRARQEERMKAFRTYFDTALSRAPGRYAKLEEDIAAEVGKLVGGS